MGDCIEIDKQGGGILLKHVSVIPKDPRYFHMPEWQKKEEQADKDIEKRDIVGLFDNAEDAIAALREQNTDADLFSQELKKRLSAILHRLMVMGEALNRQSPDFRVQHPEVPWVLIAGMRDKLIHGYDTVDLDQVWQAVDGDVTMLLPLIQRLLPIG